MTAINGMNYDRIYLNMLQQFHCLFFLNHMLKLKQLNSDRNLVSAVAGYLPRALAMCCIVHMASDIITPTPAATLAAGLCHTASLRGPVRRQASPGLAQCRDRSHPASSSQRPPTAKTGTPVKTSNAPTVDRTPLPLAAPAPAHTELRS